MGLISDLIAQLYLLSCGKTAFQKTIVHTTGRTLKLPLGLYVRSPGNALNHMGSFSLFKRDLALSNIWLYVTGCLWGRTCCCSLYTAGLLSSVFRFIVFCLQSGVSVCLATSTPEVLFPSYFLLSSDPTVPY